MNVRSLGWAGIELESQGSTVVIDPVLGWGSIEPFMGPPRAPLVASRRPGAAVGGFVTHLHADHTDARTLERSLATGATLHRPHPMEGEPLEIGGVASVEAELAETSLDQRLMDEWQAVETGPFRATAVPAVDGFGDPQISWVIEADGRRVIHAGDTIFHGSWWLIKMRLGPFDAAFLPVNGGRASFPHRQPPSGIEASLTPEQAVAAARILEARYLVPIHYDAIHQPPIYEQTEHVLDRLEAALTDDENLRLAVLNAGGTLDL